MSWFKRRPKVRESEGTKPALSSPMSQKLLKETREKHAMDPENKHKKE